MFCQSKIFKILYFLKNICKIRILHFNEYLYLDNNLSTMYMFNMSMQNLPIQVLIFIFFFSKLLYGSRLVSEIHFYMVTVR